MIARYGQDYSTAMSRAFAAGILGRGDEAKARYQGGKRFAALHTRFFGGYSYVCALNRDPHGHAFAPPDVPDWQHKQRQWLTNACDALDTAGLRTIIDELISVHYTDTGPAWLDRLLACKAQKRDHATAAQARHALDILAPPQTHIRTFVSFALDNCSEL